MATEEKSHTGQYLAEITSEVIEEVGPQKVLAFITDNAAAMISARREIERKFTSISTYSCAAHSLNLLVEDIVKLETFKDLDKSAKAIVNSINKSHCIKANFLKLQKIKSVELHAQIVSLKLPGKTRWGSMVFCIESLLSNKQALKTLSITENIILKTEVKRTILADEFWCGLVSLHRLLSPIVKWITILEGDRCVLSKVPEAFFDIHTSFEKTLTDSPTAIQDDDMIRRNLQKRREMTLRPIHYAGNILDPKSNGRHISKEQQIEGNQMIHNRVQYLYGTETDAATEVMTDLANYRDRNGVYAQDYVIKSMETLDARIWWRGNFFGSKLSSIASDILSMPCTSAATERSFSRYGNVHTVKRNRLLTSRAGKLTYVSYGLKLAKRKEKVRKQKRMNFNSEQYNNLEAPDNVVADSEDDNSDCNWSEVEFENSDSDD